MAVLRPNSITIEAGVKGGSNAAPALVRIFPSRRLLALFLLAAIMIVFGLAPSAHAQIAASGEYKIKAVYLYNFVQYVDWPAGAFADEKSPLIIGVLGNDPFGKILDETV